MDEIKQNLETLNERFQKISAQFDLEKLESEVRELEAQTMKEKFWHDQDQARIVTQKLSQKQKFLNNLREIESRILTALEMADEPSMTDELNMEIGHLERSLDELELNLFLSGSYDENEAILSIHSGAGGTEAMDWVAMLSRMYQRYFDTKYWEYEISDEDPGEEAGFKTISMIIHQPYSYGLLKAESGTHRLVRQSPFNADKLRQTSFALVEVLPVIEEDRAEVEIKPEEIEFEAFRSSGAGGQNVNKVSTAVRLKHLPSGIVVTAQTERSQQQNRENALKILRAKLWLLKSAQEKKEMDSLKGPTKQASWGTQIRSYVLHPYKMVKDLRTDVETSDAEGVLDGDLENFIEAELRLIHQP